MSLLLSCSDKIEKPEKFLEKEEMTNLIYDLTLLSSSRMYQHEDSLIKKITPQAVLSKYGLDSLSFVELNNYYINQPKVYGQLYDSVNQRFKKEILRIEALPEDPRDTIGASQIVKIKDIKSFLK